MADRKGLGRGTGKGYKNIVGKDPRVHSDSARGMKQPQRNVEKASHLIRTIQKENEIKDLKTIKDVRDYLIKAMPEAKNRPMLGARFLKINNVLRTVGVAPIADQFRKFSSEYVPGQVTDKVYHRLKQTHFKVTSLYLEIIDDDVKNPKLQKVLRKLDIQVMKYLSAEGKSDSVDFDYEFIKDDEGKEQLIIYGKEFPKEESELFKLLIRKVKRG